MFFISSFLIVISKYERYPTFGFPRPESLRTSFALKRLQIQCVPCMAGRYNPKYGYPNSPEWDPIKKKMTNGTDCFFTEDYKVSDCDDVACHACGPGQMSSAYALTCTSCAPGRFQDASISSDCKVCIAGQFSQNNGSVVCKFDDFFFVSRDSVFLFYCLVLLTLVLFFLL